MPVKKYNGTSWVVISGAGQAGAPGADGASGAFGAVAVSSNITLATRNKYFVNTTAARTLTLPASPVLGDEIWVYDATGTAGTNNITVLDNGNKINGYVGYPKLIDLDANFASFVYTGSTYGWKYYLVG